jgi:argininosuccinate lyase
MLKTATFRKIPLSSLEADGFLTATDVADYLVGKGVPFRDAHEITGKTVAYCIQRKKRLKDLKLSEFKTLSAWFKEDVFDCLPVEKSVDRKNVYGGTAKNRVREQIARLDKKLKDWE